MATQNIIYFDGGQIIKTRSSYKVTLEEENCTLFIPISDVEEILSICSEDEYLISALLGYIEYIRRSSITSDNPIKKIEIAKIKECLGNIFNNYPVENIIHLFRGLKWHEISSILNSYNPSKEINEL